VPRTPWIISGTPSGRLRYMKTNPKSLSGFDPTAVRGKWFEINVFDNY
jgi:hypothetical protein